MRGGAGRLRELHVEIILELFWHLIVAGEREAADELVVGVGTLAVLRQSGDAPDNRLGRDVQGEWVTYQVDENLLLTLI